MTFRPSPLALALSSALSLTLAGCGGGGGGTDTFRLPGTTATGMPYPDGSTVTVTDAEGSSYSSKVDGGAGAYTVEVSKSAKPPFVVKVSAEDMPTLVSVSTEQQPARINVTPITNLIAATLSPSGNPENLASEIKADAGSFTAEKLASKKQEVVDNILKPVTTALGDNTDPISGSFDIGKGHDLVLEALKIQVQPTGSNTSSVSVSLKSDTSVDMPPIPLGSGSAATLPTLADALGSTELKKSDLATDGLPTEIAALLARMTACFALPMGERIKAGGTAAADIQADTCKSLFLGSDPSKFLHNSHGVSSTGAFKGIFSPSAAAQALKYSLPSFEYKVKNGNTTDAAKPMEGDVVFTARWVDGEGNSNVEEYWARPDSTGKLYLTGNLSPLDIEVTPRAEYREFVNLTNKNFYSTGYNVYANAKHSYGKIVVTTPTNKTLTLVKRTGYDFYVLLAKDGKTPTNTSVVRLAGAYESGTNTSTPRDDFTGIFWAGTADTSDADLAKTPLQGTWTFDLYTNASDTVAAFTGIKRRTLQRAPTIAELKAGKQPTLTDAMRTDIKESTATNGYASPEGGSTLKIATGTNDDQPAWTVPSGAWSPTKATVFGTDPTTALAFNDAAGFSSAARKAEIKCTAAGSADKHCANSAGAFAQGLQVLQLQLSGRDSRRVQMNYAVDFRNK